MGAASLVQQKSAALKATAIAQPVTQALDDLNLSNFSMFILAKDITLWNEKVFNLEIISMNLDYL